MISKPTVLILGAGASIMYGFPSSKELREMIISRFRSPTTTLYEEYNRMGFQNRTVNEFSEAFRQSGVTSIDSFLEHRPEFMKIGKNAIAEALIPFETETSLFGREIDWYGYLLDKMNTPIQEFSKNKLRIITFNYDRSLEWYLFKALQSRYGLRIEEAIDLVKQIGIIHLYGTLGGMMWEDDGRLYNPSTDRPEIYKARDKLKIIYEHISEIQEFDWAHKELLNAKRIVFLGFGHNKENVARLAPDKWCRSDQILQSSGYGLTDLEKKCINRLYDRELDFGNSDWDILKFLREKVDLEEK